MLLRRVMESMIRLNHICVFDASLPGLTHIWREGTLGVSGLVAPHRLVFAGNGGEIRIVVLRLVGIVATA